MRDYFAEFKEIINYGLENGLIYESDFCIISGSLSKYTSFRTGGPAIFFIPKNEKALSFAFKEINKNSIKHFVLGNGTNTLFPDKGYDGIVILMSEFSDIELYGDEIISGAGAGFTKLSKFASENSLTGLEFAYGIPGTVGGALYMNAGAYGGEIKDVVVSAKYINKDGKIIEYGLNRMELGYRTSIFQKICGIIISVKIKLSFGKKEDILMKMKELMDRRKEKQPLEYPSAGSVFKRLPNKFTAKLIEDNGLKGTCIGGAMVSEKHAGFIVNYDNASTDDVLNLIKLIQKKIFESEGEMIQTEIRIVE